ncbi:MAG: ATP-binding protein [Phycisphaerales bacterium]
MSGARLSSPAPTHGSATPAPSRGTIVVREGKAGIEPALVRLVVAIEEHAYPKAGVFAMRLALHEAITNAIVHGHKGMPETTPVLIEYEVTASHATFTVVDQGPGFDPEAIPDPTLDENLENTSGRGLMLIRAYMAEVSHNAAGNRLTMRFVRK